MARSKGTKATQGVNGDAAVLSKQLDAAARFAGELQPCPYQRHRSLGTDWLNAGGRVICGVCRPPARGLKVRLVEAQAPSVPVDVAPRGPREGAVRLLDRALDVFDGSGVHSVGALARDKDGARVRPSSPYAVRFDANGALAHIARADTLDATPALALATDLTARAAIERGYTSAMRCNDLMGKPGAVWMLRRARDLADTTEEHGV